MKQHKGDPRPSPNLVRLHGLQGDEIPLLTGTHLSEALFFLWAGIFYDSQLPKPVVLTSIVAFAAVQALTPAYLWSLVSVLVYPHPLPQVHQSLPVSRITEASCYGTTAWLTLCLLLHGLPLFSVLLNQLIL